MLAADQARRAYELIQARTGQGAALECRRCNATGARPVRLQHQGIWLAVLLCPECVIEGRAQGYPVVPYRP